jgi:hypothetical protein
MIGFVLAAVLMAFFATQSVALAHNAGHVILPSGECVNVGSLKEAPYVPAANPNQTDNGQLDLIADPKNGTDTTDQYGARYAAIQGNTPILPGECP